MKTIIIYQCVTCKNAWEKKNSFIEHCKKRGHSRSAVIKINEKDWNDLKAKYPEEDEI